MNYYYLDGVNKKGPFTKEEILDLHLPESTWVYGDGMDNWKSISDIDELHHKVEEDSKKIESDSSPRLIMVKEDAPRVSFLKKCMIKFDFSLLLKYSCAICMFALTIYNVVLSYNIISSLSRKIEHNHCNNQDTSLVMSAAMLLSATILAIAIFAKNVMNKSNQKKQIDL